MPLNSRFVITEFLIGCESYVNQLSNRFVFFDCQCRFSLKLLLCARNFHVRMGMYSSLSFLIRLQNGQSEACCVWPVRRH